MKRVCACVSCKIGKGVVENFDGGQLFSTHTHTHTHHSNRLISAILSAKKHTSARFLTVVSFQAFPVMTGKTETVMLNLMRASP